MIGHEPDAQAAFPPTDVESLSRRHPWWRRPAAQQPSWPDEEHLISVVKRLERSRPLVSRSECDALRKALAGAVDGSAFCLTGGECAETFADAREEPIVGRLKTLLQMAVVLGYGSGVPVVRVGRMAGQYSKPRSSPVEERGGTVLESYRGDLVNGLSFTAEARRPDPSRMLTGYAASSMTLGLVRAQLSGQLGDLRNVHDLNAGFAANLAYGKYERTADQIDRAMAFMRACGVDFDRMDPQSLYASHEALLLDYESALVRSAPDGSLYAGSGHLLWVGDRTRHLDGAHIDLLSRITNPVGVKVGPSMTAAELVRLVRLLNPQRVPGRLSLITRFGARNISEQLPPLLRAVRDEGTPVVWICDPMHGNTLKTASGRKTRRFSSIVAEVGGFFAAHREEGTVPGGIHVELTGDDVTECTGGARRLRDTDLGHRYETACDPRLNHEQSLELAYLVADMLPRQRRGHRMDSGTAPGRQAIATRSPHEDPPEKRGGNRDGTAEDPCNRPHVCR